MLCDYNSVDVSYSRLYGEFMMMDFKRTHYCGEVTKTALDQEVVVTGWVQKIRDKGVLVFVDLRDRTGIVQLAFDDASNAELRALAQTVRAEFVLLAKGKLRIRESINHDLANGDVEIYVDHLEILAKAETPPFEITDTTNVKEELRLKYRYLDLRRREMQDSIIFRHKIVKAARDYYDQNGFLEIETPTMIKSTPEGARDYLIPSRVQSGSFFALPQSPQLYKQLLMLSGYDRYMQIARCYRDEDLRADRQPEFTQIDLEMSFVDADDVMSMNEGLVKHVFKTALDVEIKAPFARLTYAQAMEQYGSDKPDTRYEMKLCDLSDLLKDTEFKVFAGAIANGGSVRCIVAKNAASTLTRKEVDKLVEFVKTYRAKGLAYTRITEETRTSSFEKFLSESEVAAINDKLNLEVGDVLFVVADSNNVVFDSLGALRCHLADKLGIIPADQFNLLWVTDFPLFEYDEENDRYAAKHHPFTAPKQEDIPNLLTDPANCHAIAYDMVMNGYEIGGGSIRINQPDLQKTMFKALGFSDEDAQERFGFLIDAFKYGAPPHGGMAFGLDRLVMVMLQKDNIKEVIAFPKVQTSSELMTGCPTPVEQKNLDELSIAVVAKEQP